MLLIVADPAPHRIMSATIRDNILFSHEYDETFYNLVIEGKCYTCFPPPFI